LSIAVEPFGRVFDACLLDTFLHEDIKFYRIHEKGERREARVQIFVQPGLSSVLEQLLSNCPRHTMFAASRQTSRRRCTAISRAPDSSTPAP